MKSAFRTQDALYELLSNDQGMLDLLGNPVNDEEKNNKLRREVVPIEIITPDSLDFLSFFFPNTMPTPNMKVNKGILVIDYYCSLRYNAMMMSEKVRELISKELDLDLISEGQIPSGIVGVFQYRQRYAPLVWG